MSAQDLVAVYTVQLYTIELFFSENVDNLLSQNPSEMHCYSCKNDKLSVQKIPEKFKDFKVEGVTINGCNVILIDKTKNMILDQIRVNK